ncbi:hypothetical protein [Nitrospira sp. BLG_2]|uniref:hypothetical protein n=1 Tax=Nitrospira sp. BLG_2 TaxID=3397507 RepID=UPI003B9D111C
MTDHQTFYEVCREDEEGFEPLGWSFATREEAEQRLRELLPNFPGAFVVRTTMSRCGPRIWRPLKAV